MGILHSGSITTSLVSINNGGYNPEAVVREDAQRPPDGTLLEVHRPPFDPVKEVKEQRRPVGRGITQDVLQRSNVPGKLKAEAPDSRRPHCKPRPKDNRPKGGGGGGGFRGFKPWCG